MSIDNKVRESEEQSKEQQLWDPLRKKYVAFTPEEKVRQWFIAFLSEELSVPKHMMISEISMKYGDKTYRADILVYNKNAKVLAIVECKRPDVQLNDNVIQQVLRYNAALNVYFIFVTNGIKTFFFGRDNENESFKPLSSMLTYKEMLLKCQ